LITYVTEPRNPLRESIARRIFPSPGRAGEDPEKGARRSSEGLGKIPGRVCAARVKWGAFPLFAAACR
jgi:hypothetical protein